VTMHRALKSAVRLGILSRNVADNVDVPGIERHEMQTMTEDDIQAFLEAAKSTPYFALFHTALFTGMRRSELLALRWSDIDLLMCQASVNRTLHRLNNGEIIFRETKTAKSRRMVALSPRTCLVLQEYRRQQKQDRLLASNSLQESDLVFSRLDGKPLLPDTVTHAFMVLARRTGLMFRYHRCSS
jgi:integrase